MMPMSLTEIAQAVDGRLMPTTVPTDEPVAISAFTDSRQIVPGSVFVAIAGERVDGHDFVPKVGAQGAVAALVDHEIAGAQVPQIVVENTVKALGALAKHNIERRRALESPFTVIGITGSVGKTTTTVNLGVGLASSGKRVLLVDADPQGSLTVSLGIKNPDELEVSLSSFMQSVIDDEPLAEGAIIRHQEGVDLLPSNIELFGMKQVCSMS